MTTETLVAGQRGDGRGGQAWAQPGGAGGTSSSRRWDSGTRRKRSATRSIHEARRLRQAGDVGLGAGGPRRRGRGEDRNAGGPVGFSDWSQLVKRRFGGALVPHGDGETLAVVAALGMRWRPGKVVSERSLRGLRSL